MTTLPFEPSGKWSVGHGQDYQADIVNSRNIDLSYPGFVGLARKAVSVFNEDTDTDFGTVMAIVPKSSGTSTTHYFITTENQFSWDSTTSAFTELATSSQPSTGFDSDGVIFNSNLHVSGGSTVKYYDGSWHAGISGLSASYPKPMCALDFQPYLAVGNQNVVKTYDTGYSVIATCTLPTDVIVTGIRSKNGNLYIATRAIGGAAARLFVWNGSGTVAQSAWDVRADWIYSLVDFQSSICVLTSAGQLLRFTGAGFGELAHFPVYDSPYSWATSSSLSNSTGRCANRGMIGHGDVLFLCIDGGINVPNQSNISDPPGKFLATQPSGLWVYDAEVGLYPHGGFAPTRFTASTFTISSNKMVTSSAHNLETGDPIYFTVVSGVTGVNVGQTYYAVISSTTSFQLAQTRTEALAGTVITVSGVPTTDAFVLDAFDTFGNTYTQTFPGAVGLFVTDNPPGVIGGEVIYTGDATKSDGTSISSAMSFGTSHNRGYFVTTPLPSKDALDTFQKLFQFNNNLFRDDDKIVVKYRTATRYGFPLRYRTNSSSSFMASWTSTTTFTVTRSGKDFGGVEVGDEIDIIEGAAAGYTAHITAIDSTSTTWTITIDEALPVSVSGKSEIIVDNWTKLATITNATNNIEKDLAETPVGKKGSWVQYKIEMRGIDVSIRKLISVNASHKKVQ
jgi:hypothetical protein